MRSKNTDQLWFEGKKTGAFRREKRSFFATENDLWTDDIEEFEKDSRKKILAVFFIANIPKSPIKNENIRKYMPKVYKYATIK